MGRVSTSLGTEFAHFCMHHISQASYSPWTDGSIVLYSKPTIHVQWNSICISLDSICTFVHNSLSKDRIWYLSRHSVNLIVVAVRIHIFSTRWRWEYVWQLDIHVLQNKTSWRDAGLWSSHKKRAVKCFKCMCLAFVHIRSYDVNTTRHWGPVVHMQTPANLPCHAMPIEHIPKPSSYITYPNRIWFRYVDLHEHADMHDLAYWFGNMSLKCFTVADLTTTIIWGHRLGSLRISIKWGFVSVWRMSLPVNVWKGELSL